MADEYDFQINDLKFRSAVSDKHPYQRATAPFRKEQFDSAPTVGDQSLTGWWTRGQLSFHKGAGLKYYEVLEGEDVLNRFKTGEAVEVFEPGQVTLRPAQQAIASTAQSARGVASSAGSVTHASWTEYDGANTVWKVDAGGTVSTITNTFGNPQPGQLVGDALQYYAAAYDGAASPPASVLSASRSGGTASRIYSHTDLITGLWYAKGRLWATDALGGAYALVTNPATPPRTMSSDKIFEITDASNTDRWSFTAGPGPVYFSVKNRIYKVQPNDDGSVPVLAGAVVVTQLADGESIRGIQYLLGGMIVATNRGIRAAVIDDAGFPLVGPLLVKGVTAGRTIGVAGSTAYVLMESVEGEAGARLVAVDAANLNDDLTFPWVSMAVTVDTSASPGCGVSPAYGGVVVWGEQSGSAVLTRIDSNSTSSLAATGSVTTALHRFGTLEWKHFSSVRIRVAGDGGTVDTYLVEQDGTETLLGSIDAATATGADVAFSSGPTEAVGLKFVLAPSTTDATVGPELLGYQLKAMPVPERQRLMRWPLLLTDTYRTRYGKERGARGGAYTALSTLESLESTNAVVTFTDLRTGETGSAYIESVEFESNTSSSHNTTGFGGVAQLTLRVLD